MKLSVSIFLLFFIYIAGTSALYCKSDNCYDLLGVKRSATKAEIRRSYRKLSSENHPDKHKGDEAAAETFRKIGAAYEALTDDTKRAKYNDFLDNPLKYIDFLEQHSKEHYAPKSNVFLVITGVIGLATLLHWLHLNTSYQQTVRRMKESPGYQKEVARLIKLKKAKTKEEAEGMIQLDVVGLEAPHWEQLFIFKLRDVPIKIANRIKWNINWIISYKIRKMEYSTADKIYLIQKNMHITPEEWEAASEKKKASYIDAELWNPDNCDEFKRLERIEMNRLGKGKKKKKTSSQYSELDDTMSD